MISRRNDSESLPAEARTMADSDPPGSRRPLFNLKLAEGTQSGSIGKIPHPGSIPWGRGGKLGWEPRQSFLKKAL